MICENYYFSYNYIFYPHKCKKCGSGQWKKNKVAFVPVATTAFLVMRLCKNLNRPIQKSQLLVEMVISDGYI